MYDEYSPAISTYRYFITDWYDLRIEIQSGNNKRYISVISISCQSLNVMFVTPTLKFSYMTVFSDSDLELECHKEKE